MEKVGENLYRISLPVQLPTPNKVFVYLIRGIKGNILVDTGWNSDETLEELVRDLEENDIQLSSIKKIVLTHLHVDHFGLALRIRKLTGAPLLVHEKELLVFKMFEKLPFEKWLRSNGFPTNELTELVTMLDWIRSIMPENFDQFIKEGENISSSGEEINVVYTPGHTPGNICLYNKKQRLLISGDHVLRNITPNILYYPFIDNYNPLGDYLHSLKTISKLDVRTVLPSHGPIFTDVKARIKEMEDHHEIRLNEVINASSNGPKTAQKIATEISWSPGQWKNLFLFDKFLALMETISHLEFLKSNGKITRINQEHELKYVSSSKSG